jgi:ubiquinone/menaquinone biosynthesis C-methylase UbiE
MRTRAWKFGSLLVRVVERMWHALGCQLRNPRGATGSIVGWLMAFVNDEPNRLAIDALDPRPGETVLELGFGPGWSLRTIAARTRGARVYGVDHSARMLEQATRMNEVAVSRGRMELVQGPFNPLPWIDEMFDKVLLVNVAYFFDSHGRDISEAYRVLRSGGRLVVYVTARETMEKWPFARPDTHRTFDANDLSRLLVSAGFRQSQIVITHAELAFGVKGFIAIAEKSGGSIRDDQIARRRSNSAVSSNIFRLNRPRCRPAKMPGGCRRAI